MLTVLALALSVGVATIGPGTTSAAGAVVVRGDVGFFYDALAPYGSWVTVAAYGDVWVPRVSRWWRPYSDGHWVYTDDGWCWVDDEPWGWATFHYGRWYFDPDNGWVWVPGTVWAPAWVAWRWGDGFIGWAPLPPDVAWNFGFGLEFSGGDFDRAIAPGHWCFVDQRHFTDPRIHAYLAPTTRNVTYVRMTRNVTNYTVFNNRVVDRGLDVRQVERFTGRPVPRLRIVDSHAPGVHVVGRELGVYRPSFARRAQRVQGSRFETPHTRGAVARPHSRGIVQRSHSRGIVERPRTRGVAGHPRTTRQVRRPDVRRPQERTRQQAQQRARVSRNASPQRLRGRQEVRRQMPRRQPQRGRQVVQHRVQRNARPRGTKGNGGRGQKRPPG
jgi:Family of unknown function (DUF6600)